MAPSTPQDGSDPAASAYWLCPRCGRAVPAGLGEVFCSNDGTPLLTGCPACGQPILSPYARHCTRCGAALTRLEGDS